MADQQPNTVVVTMPDGSEWDLPASKLDAAMKRGAKLKETPKASTTPEPSLLGTGMKAIPGMLAGVASGAGKGLLDQAVGAGQMVQKVPGVTALTDKLYGVPGISTRAMDVAHQELAPKGGAETVGKTISDIGTMALAPGESIPARMASSAAIGGAQGGVPGALFGAAGAGIGGLASKGASKLADVVREGPASAVAGPAITSAYKGQPAIPAGARTALTQRYGELIKRFGITGGKGDAAIIAKAPQGLQDELNQLSDQLSKPKAFGHIWSTLAALSGMGGLVGMGGNPEGLAMALPLAGMGIANKYPGITAKALEVGGPMAGRAIGALGGLPNGIKIDPMTQALLDQENNK